MAEPYVYQFIMLSAIALDGQWTGLGRGDRLDTDVSVRRLHDHLLTE